MSRSSSAESIIKALDEETHVDDDDADLEPKEYPPMIWDVTHQEVVAWCNEVVQGAEACANMSLLRRDTTDDDSSLTAAPLLSEGLLEIYQPPLVRVRGNVTELLAKQKYIYSDILAAKLKNNDIYELQEMMMNVKIYREKLIKIKNQMQSIYQRTKDLKKRADHIKACKQKELERKQQKQQQEESLIGK